MVGVQSSSGKELSAIWLQPPLSFPLPIGSLVEFRCLAPLLPTGTPKGRRARPAHGRSMRSGSLLRGRLNVGVMVHTCVRVLHRHFFLGVTVAVVMRCIDRFSEKMGQQLTHI